MKINIAFLLLVSHLMIGCTYIENSHKSAQAFEEKILPYEVRLTLAHDPDAFTQGLVYYNGKLLESTGGDSSWVAEYEVETGNYERKVVLDRSLFGEGITVLNNKLFQLTWKNKIGYVYDLNTYKQIAAFPYDFEGWGITHDHHHLIISDGTDKLHYFDTLTLQEVFAKSIKHNNRKASKLNELEFIEGFIYANKLGSNYLLKIDTGKSEVVKELDFTYLAKENKRLNRKADVLNGIAYDTKTKDVYITGKLWPQLYVLRLKE